MMLLLTLLACNPGNPQIKDTTAEDPVVDCQGDNDGVVTAQELQVEAGISVPYRSSAEGERPTFDPFGEEVDGELTWDFEASPGSLAVDLEVFDPAEMWFAESFPGATFASASFAQAPDLLGVFSQDDQAIWLLGYASREEAPAEGKTLLVYDTPVDAYRFPLEEGSSWTAETEFHGAFLQGLQNGGQESWAFEVDARGTALVPGFGLENTLRLTIALTQTLDVSAGGPTHTYRQILWMRECFGDVARAVAAQDEPDVLFTTANELHRIDTD